MKHEATLIVIGNTSSNKNLLVSQENTATFIVINMLLTIKLARFLLSEYTCILKILMHCVTGWGNISTILNNDMIFS